MLSATLIAQSSYVIDVSTPSGVAMFVQPAETAKLWHRCMGHSSYRLLAQTHRFGLLQGCRLTHADVVQAGLTPSNPCIRATTRRESHTAPVVKTDVLLHRRTVDMKGPLPLSLYGCKYAVTDEASGNRAVGPIHAKSDAPVFVISMIVLRETQVQVCSVFDQTMALSLWVAFSGTCNQDEFVFVFPPHALIQVSCLPSVVMLLSDRKSVV